jgi:UDP-3-O-[3-hydroxymyristoyl] N-acetylglucosamine deacetylase
MGMRRTLSGIASVSGVGLHGGRPSNVTVGPSDGGIRFVLPSGASIAADASNVERVPLCTRLVAGRDRVDTVEHLMAAFAILGVTDAVVGVDGPELPILDGSARTWLDALEGVGTRLLPQAVEDLVVVRPFTFRVGSSEYEALPGRESIEVTIDFPHAAVGVQHVSALRRDYWTLADSRTFAFERDIVAMRAAGLALGGSLDNAVVLGESGVLNPGGLRHEDELVRHKALDLIGDLWMAGRAISGAIRAHRPGHAANNAFLAALVASGAATAARSPLAAAA